MTLKAYFYGFFSCLVIIYINVYTKKEKIILFLMVPLIRDTYGLPAKHFWLRWRTEGGRAWTSPPQVIQEGAPPPLAFIIPYLKYGMTFECKIRKLNDNLRLKLHSFGGRVGDKIPRGGGRNFFIGPRAKFSPLWQISRYAAVGGLLLAIDQADACVLLLIIDARALV